jgi:predicted heme/steroid binding protein
MSGLKVFSRADVKQHNKEDDCYIIIDDKVYDMTKFMGMHPGGEGVIMQVAGQDATEQFFGMHRHEILVKYSKKLLIGELDAEGKKSVKKFDNPAIGKISKIPFMESSSPYYTESHHRLRKFVRTWCETHLAAIAKEDDFPQTEHMPKEIMEKMGKAGLLALIMGPGDYLGWEGVPELPAGLTREEFNYFHVAIVLQETKRLGNYGLVDGLGGGMCIGLPPVLHFGSEALAKKIIPPIIRGEKCIALAIRFVSIDPVVSFLGSLLHIV